MKSRAITCYCASSHNTWKVCRSRLFWICWKQIINRVLRHYVNKKATIFHNFNIAKNESLLIKNARKLWPVLIILRNLVFIFIHCYHLQLGHTNIQISSVISSRTTYMIFHTLQYSYSNFSTNYIRLNIFFLYLFCVNLQINLHIFSWIRNTTSFFPIDGIIVSHFIINEISRDMITMCFH